MPRPKYIPATKRFRGKIYRYHSHGDSTVAMRTAKGLRKKGWAVNVSPSGRPGVSIIYRRPG